MRSRPEPGLRVDETFDDMGLYALAAEAAWCNAFNLATTEQLMVAFETVGETLDSAAPSGAAYQTYFRLLCHLPAAAIEEMTDELLRSYRYKSFPTPAEFLEHGEAEAARLRSTYKVICSMAARWKRELPQPKED